MENYVIQEWYASYYCWESRVWKYGKLTLCSKCICFLESSGSNDPTIVADLRRITGFQRRLVSLMYRAIVISVECEKPLWFSSFNNREEVFYFLEHFWKQRLLYLVGPGEEPRRQARNDDTSNSSTSQAEKRQKLLEVLYDSENTLIKASDSLFNQGEQLHHSSRTMNKMHKDLNVTETLLNSLDKWFLNWEIKPEHFYEIKSKKEYPVLYRKNTKESFYPGVLVLLEDQLTVLSIKRVADVSILLKQLTSIIVNTPWNVVLVRSAIGEGDVMIDVSSAQVVYILKALEQKNGHKFHYEDVSFDAKKTVKIPVIPRKLNEVTELQTCDASGVSETDAADLEAVSDVVSKMKSMAVGINQEMTRQLDSLDQLSESVDKANYRIKKGSRKVEEKL